MSAPGPLASRRRRTLCSLRLAADELESLARELGQPAGGEPVEACFALAAKQQLGEGGGRAGRWQQREDLAHGAGLARFRFQ
jgi:hypothetical protein